ncbi:MAG: hypothetical protein IKF97_05885 [Clostridia bacterium]|nr:hypothetical protein [Clostridia bacterium]
MDIPIRKLITYIIILFAVAIALFIGIQATKPAKEEKTEETISEESNSDDEKLEKIIEDTIKENNNIVVQNEKQTITYEPKETENKE